MKRGMIILLAAGVMLSVCSMVDNSHALESETLSEEGYVLNAPLSSKDVYLIDNDGDVVHQWTTQSYPGLATYLLDNGNLLRTGRFGMQNRADFNAGGAGGLLSIMAPDSQVLWEYTLADTEQQAHHDVAYLPNGNILVTVWEKKTYSEAIEAGRNPSLLAKGELWPDKIMELKPIGVNEAEVVWEWHVWDHLVQDYDSTQANFGVVSEEPGKININYKGMGPSAGSADWTHTNAIDYNEELDQILLSVHGFNEIWIIDHCTTSEEAAGDAGDLLYRWGNPLAYGKGDRGDQLLNGQHDAQWIEEGLDGAGEILIYNNNVGDRQNKHSTLEEIQIPRNDDGTYQYDEGNGFGPGGTTWSFGYGEDEYFYSNSISGVQRLRHGNTLMCVGESGYFAEITSDGNLIWEYVNPYGMKRPNQQTDSESRYPVFKIRKYYSDEEAIVHLFAY